MGVATARRLKPGSFDRHWYENVIPVRHVILEPQAKNLKRWRRPFASLKGDKTRRFSSSRVPVATAMADWYENVISRRVEKSKAS